MWKSEREQLLVRAIDLPPDQLRLIEGTYDQGAGPFELVRNGSNLEVRRGERGVKLLVAVGPYRFELLDRKAELQFLLHDGELTGYIVKAGQREIRGERVK